MISEKEYHAKAIECFTRKGYAPIALIATGIELLIHDKYCNGEPPESVLETYESEHAIGQQSDGPEIEIVKPRKTKTTPVGDLYNGTYIRLTPRSKWIYEKVSNPEVSAKTGNLLVKLEKLDTGDVKWIPPEQRVYLAEEFN